MNLLSGAAPIFLSKNYINRDSINDLIATSGQDFAERIYDMVRESYWISVGSNDTITEDITVGLYQGVSQVSREIDFIALMNINFKRFAVEFSNDNGVSWAAVPEFNYSETDFAGTDKIAEISSPVTANKLRLKMFTTQIANQEKKIGEFIATKSIFQAFAPMNKYQPGATEQKREIVFYDGSTEFVLTRRAAIGFDFYNAGIEWRHVSLSDREKFRALRGLEEPFLWYPFPGDDPTLIKLATMAADSYKEPYTTEYLGNGFSVSFQVQEVGGG